MPGTLAVAGFRVVADAVRFGLVSCSSACRHLRVVGVVVESARDGIPHLRQLLTEIGDELFLRGKRRRITNADNRETGLRVTVIGKLVSAIDEVDGLARKSARWSPKGGGGIPPKLRWYQLMAHLVQALDAVLKNENMERFEGKMEEMERTVEELQRTSRRST